ncbi:MAG: YkgJ family cysteine cluster protein [Spirochaetaceae bacterium]|jgi:Fe-S-cluster containining protein|nr:YkgJ family cysteine cluster protein [Spirochaetaceae bacterium]
MKKTPFYEEGLRFSCARCSACCRYESGFVFLSSPDLDALSGELKMKTDEFIAVYCRWIGAPGGFFQLSLREKSNLDCIFWKEGCTVYRARPRQCRSFPFWPSVLESRAIWENTALSCPGMGKGPLHTREEIEGCLLGQLGEAIITRELLL